MNLFLPRYSCKIAALALNNNHSLTILYLNNCWCHRLSWIEQKIHMTTFVSQKLNIIKLSNIIVFFIITPFTRLYVRVDILMTCWKQLPVCEMVLSYKCLPHMSTMPTFTHNSVIIVSAGFRTNEALCQLSYEVSYLGPEGGRPTTLPLCLESLRNRTPSNLKLHHIGKNPS